MIRTFIGIAALTVLVMNPGATVLTLTSLALVRMLKK